MTVRRCRVSSRGSADRASKSPCPARGCAGKPTMTSETDDSTGYRRYLARRYLASLPERTARAGAALTGGLVYETGELLARKTAGNVVEIGSFLAVGWSPVWLLAGASDLIGGSKAYLRVLVTELKEGGVLSAEEDVASFEELLTALEGTSGVLADTVDVPPLNVAGVRASCQELRRQAGDLPDAQGLEKIFSQLRLAARREDRSVMEISSVVALGAVRTGVKLGNVHVFDYYRGALRTIADEGLVSFLYRITTPYLTRARSHFDPGSSTLSERLLRRWADRRSSAASRTTQGTESSAEDHQQRKGA